MLLGIRSVFDGDDSDKDEAAGKDVEQASQSSHLSFIGDRKGPVDHEDSHKVDGKHNGHFNDKISNSKKE